MGNMSVILPAAVVVVLGIVAAVVVIKAQDKLDYERITEDVEDRGGKVVKIVSDWSGESDERCYKVTYTTSQGEQLSATCETSMIKGVRWISETLPGVSAAGGNLGRQPVEFIVCPACGARVPWAERCAKCGRAFDG